MAKRDKNKGRRGGSAPSIFELLSKETWNAIWGVLTMLLAIFLLMAAWEMGGRVGYATYVLLTYLFGVGYYLVPLAFLLLSVSFFRSQEKEFALPQILGSALFFVSSLGLTELLFPTMGGVAGRTISLPLVSLFDFYLTFLILFALIVVSLLVIFDASLKVNLIALYQKLFRREKVESKEELAVMEEEKVDKAVEQFETRKEPEEKVMPQPKPQREEAFVPQVLRSKSRAWVPPPLSLLEKDRGKPGVGDIKANANIIKRTLLNFGIVVEMDEISIGSSVTRYALKPAEGVKLSKILGLQNNLELALAAHPVRIEAPIPGKSLVGVEVPNTFKSTLGLGSLLSEDGFVNSDKPLLVTLGRDITGHSHFANIAKMPHALIAGATGSGKSVTIHSLITSLLYRNPPENLKFIMIDPKRVELTLYNNIPHLLTPVITEAKKAILALKWTAKEMERRYDLLEKSVVRDIESYHKNILPDALKGAKDDAEAPDPMPYIVIIIDELADIMHAYPRELESAIVRLAQMSRAVGIHLVLSTQRPSVNVITGLIKANIPTRIALQVASQIDSRTILDAAGAEKLLGAGDMLYQGGEMSKPMRIQSAFITESEVKKVTKYLKDEYALELNSGIDFTTENTSNAIFSATLGEESMDDDDDLYEEAREIVMQAGKASTSYLQRKLRIGYARAARLIDLLEERGVIGPGSGAKPREVIGRAPTATSDFPDEEI
ncbi:MAG: DNA translocase FtsK 4TM domain-containing protein [Parcubacteria group bacterium]